MTWIDPNACQGDRNWECTYEVPFGRRWCEDRDDSCPGVSETQGGILIAARRTGGGW